MRRNRCLAPLLLLLVMTSCKDKPSSYTTIKGIENLIYLSIEAYRTDNGLTGPFVHQYIMVREAQIYSYKVANGVEDLGTRGLTEHWNTIHSKIGGYNDQALVLRTDSDHEDVILTQLLQLPDAESILLEDVTQCGVGVESDTAGFNIVTIMLMKADS